MAANDIRRTHWLWLLDKFLASGGLVALDDVVVLPPADTCVERVLTRRNHGFKDEEAVRHMHDQFTRRPPAERPIVRQVDHHLPGSRRTSLTPAIGATSGIQPADDRPRSCGRTVPGIAAR